MVFIVSRVVGNEKQEDGRVVPITYIEGACDSSEDKPTDFIADGSTITESDSGDVYMFNAKTSAWTKMFGLKAGTVEESEE